MAASSRDEILRFVLETQGQEGLDQLTKALADAGKQGGESGAELTKLGDELATLLERARQVEALQAMQDRLAAVDEKLAAAREGLAKLNEAFSATDKSSAGVAAQFDAARKAVADLSDQHDRLAVRVSTAAAALNASGVDTKNLGAAHEELSNKAKESAARLADTAAEANRGGISFGTIREAVAKAGESLKSSGEHALEFGKHLLEISGIAGVVTSALAAITGFRFFEKGVEEARSGEVALAKLRAAVAGNAEEFEKLKEAAEHAADAVGTTSNVAVETLTKLTAQLGNADAAAKALPATLTLAKAAQIDFSESAELVATTLKAFGLEADHAGEIADKLAAIAARTGVNLAELARGAAQVAPLAKEAGVGFDGVAAALAELSSKGFDAQKSNAGLRELFLALSAPTSKLRQDLVGLGIDTSSLGSILDGLRASGDRGTDALQQLSAKGRAAVQALVQGGSADLRSFQAILDESAGSASKTAKLLGDTFDGAATAFGRAVDNLAEDAVKGALPAVKDEIKKLSDELKEVGNTDAFEKIKESIKEFVAAGVKAFDEFVHAVDWKNLGEAIKEWGQSAGETIKSVGESASTLGRIFGGIGDVVGAVWNVVKTVFTSIQSATSYLASHVISTFAAALDVVGKFSDTAKQKAQEFHDLAKQYSENSAEQWKAGDEAAERAGQALINLMGRISATGDRAKESAPKHAENAKAIEETATEADHAAQSNEKLAESVHATSTAMQGAIPNLDALIQKARASNISLEDLQGAASKAGFTMQADLAQAAKEAATRFADFYIQIDGSAGKLADARNAFLAYARAQLAAVADLDEGAKNQAKYQLESKASALGLTDQLAKLEAQMLGGVDAANQFSGATRNSGAAMRDAERQAEKYSAAMETLRDTTASAADKQKALAAAMESASTATERQAVASERVASDMVAAMGAGQSLGQIMAGTAAQFSSVSEAAGREFTSALDRAMSSIGLTKVAATDLTNQMNGLSAAASDTTGFVSYFRALAAVAQETQAKIDGQRESLNSSIGLLNTYGTSAQQNFGIAGQGADKLLASLEAQRRALQDGNSGFDLLGQNELGPLQQALDGAIQRTKALADAAKAAEQQYESLTQSIHDALLQEQGNQSALEDERHRKQLENLKAAAEAADSLNSQSYQQAVQEENQLHDLKMQNLQKQAQAQANASKSGGGASSSSGAGSSSASVSSSASSFGSGASSNANASGASGAVSRVELVINSKNYGAFDPTDPTIRLEIANIAMQALIDAKRKAGF